MLIGEDPRKHIREFSREFERTFLDTLRTTHGTKPINVNHFYNQIVADKQVCLLYYTVVLFVLADFLVAHSHEQHRYVPMERRGKD